MRLIKSIAIAALFLGVLGMNTALANCTRTDTLAEDLDMALGRVVVSPDIPVGGVIASKTWSFSRTSPMYDCTWGKYDFVAKIVSDGVDTGNKVYSTNIPGIGLKMSRKGQVSMIYPDTYNVSVGIFGNTISLAGSTFTLEVIKTAEITGTGTLKSGIYSTYDIKGGNSPILITKLSGSSITIISPSCTINSGTNMNINLGSVSKDDFNGIGSSAGNKNFNIDLQCSGGTTLEGFANINMTFSGKIPGTLSNDSGVLENEDNSDTKAKGVGIQVIKDSQPIKFDKKYRIATLQNGESRALTVPLQARYYQYENAITAGKVESHMVFNLNYD